MTTVNAAAASTSIIIRPAASADADAIARIFLDSAEHHAGLDPERYVVPAIEPIASLYRTLRQDAANADSITLVADRGGVTVGFVDARIGRSPDPMHRDVTFCHVVEIAVSRHHRSEGIGAQLLASAEAWGRRQGATFALVEYHAANARAGAFYLERMAYSVASITAMKRL